MDAPAISAIVSIVQLVMISGFILTQLAMQIRLIQRSRAKDFALISALSFIKAWRQTVRFDGPLDDDPIARLIEQMEKALEA